MDSDRATAVPRVALVLMLVFFVLSGVTGLIYQAVWSQYLGLILGHAAYAQSLVLATFMGGMALGAWIASKYFGRSGNLLRTYGLLEGAIGIFALVFHGLYLVVSGWLFDTWLPSAASHSVADLSRYLVALALIVPQTILLGMTFPVMSAGLIRWQPLSAGRVLGGLYFFNSIGAAGGALLATFYLVPAAGLPGAMTFAGILNLLIAVLVVLLRVPPQAEQARPLATGDRAPYGTGPLRFVLVAAFVTGAASFMYEIGWVRMLSLALGSSLHAFELMLAAFIGGLAFGGLYIRKRLDGLSNPMRYFGWVQILMGLSALATLPLYDVSFDFVGWMLKGLARTDNGYTLYNLTTAAVSIAIMAPAAFFAGMTLPLMTYCLMQRGVGEKAIGQVYAANTVGAILGVMLMVHFAMPMLGLKLSMVLAAAIDISLGLIVLRRMDERFQSAPYLAALVTSGLAVAFVLVASPFDPRRLASGVYRTGIARLDPAADIQYLRDGKTASIALYGQRNGSLVIATNGKPDASLMMDPKRPATMDEPTMIMAGLLALSLHPDPQRIANIGFGSGLTAHTLATSTLPTEIVSVEIEPAIVEAARGFGSRVERAYLDPRSTIVIDDARAYFAGRAEPFDVIVSEPSNPWVSGVSKLFSIEFYNFIPRHLKEGGLLVQWVQAYEMSDATLLSILAALDSRFRDYAIYTSNNFDLLIVASPDGKLGPLNPAAFGDPALRELAERVGITSVSDLAGRKVASRDVVRGLLEAAQPIPNSDFFPSVAHQAPRDRFTNRSAMGVATIYSSPGGALTLLGALPVEAGMTNPNPAPSNRPVETRLQGLAILAALDGEPEGRALGDMLPSDYSDVALLREWGATCFADADPARAIHIMTRMFRLSLARVSAHEARATWEAPSWVACADGQLPQGDAGQALRVFALAMDQTSGAQLLEQTTQVFTQTPGLSSQSLADFYALAMVGAARAGKPDEVLELHAAASAGLTRLPTEKLQLAAIAVLAHRLAGAARQPVATPGEQQQGR